MKNILDVSNLEVKFQTRRGIVQPLRGVSFQVNEGETLGIVGESGCGKSVTSLAVMGLLPNGKANISNGKVLFEGQEMTHLKERERRKLRGSKMSMIFQEPMTSLNPVFTIGDQLSQPLSKHTKLGKREMKERIIDMLKLVGISRPEEIIHQYPHQLSGGMRQRVMICLAIICEPELLIADEPTTALDVTIQAQILDLLKKIKQKNNMSIIFITHDLGVVAELCDRVIVMYTGQIVEEADVRTFFNSPKHPYSKGLLASMPKEDERKQKLYAIKGNVPGLNELPVGCSFSNRCPMAFDRCKMSPPVVQIGGQICRCWLYAEEKAGEHHGK
ncbi:ABC transporter ATP-binding protein [Sporolactobacillus sp. STCC-11]|uniref:ABC transporter ATP-binding protein n=1 Tax=Sporolactobacillus caesalpiniae TaxID=3230362 RepID=UPI00339113FA